MLAHLKRNIYLTALPSLCLDSQNKYNTSHHQIDGKIQTTILILRQGALSTADNPVETQWVFTIQVWSHAQRRKVLRFLSFTVEGRREGWVGFSVTMFCWEGSGKSWYSTSGGGINFFRILFYLAKPIHPQHRFRTLKAKKMNMIIIAKYFFFLHLFWR